MVKIYNYALQGGGVGGKEIRAMHREKKWGPGGRGKGRKLG